MESNSSERLTALVDSIKQLNPTEYEELFKLLYQNKCEYTRNNNGIFLNLSWLNEEMITKLELFIQFCKASRREILHYETICKNLSQSIPNKIGVGAAKETTDPHDASKKPIVCSMAPKNTSSMKFYLLKKKFSKNASFESLQNDLEKETVIL